MSIKEAFSNLGMSDKERRAMMATLRGVDLERVFNALDGVWEIIAPEYRKNLAALGVDHGSAEGDKTVVTTKVIDPDPDWRKANPGFNGKSPDLMFIDEYHDDPVTLERINRRRYIPARKNGKSEQSIADLCPECKEDQDND